MVTLANRPVQAIVCEEKLEDPFIFSTDLIAHLQLSSFGRQVLALAFHLLPLRLPAARGRPDCYPDEAVLVTLIVMSIRQLSPRAMARRLWR